MINKTNLIQYKLEALNYVEQNIIDNGQSYKKETNIGVCYYSLPILKVRLIAHPFGQSSITLLRI